jgi:hypothetical protein
LLKYWIEDLCFSAWVGATLAKDAVLTSLPQDRLSSQGNHR